MPTVTRNETRETRWCFGAEAENRVEEPASANAIAAEGALDRVTRLVRLLAENPVDLTRVGDEIRAEPALAALVKRVAASLQLSPEGSVNSVEEAAVALGTERLRVLLHARSFLKKIPEEEKSPVESVPAGEALASGGGSSCAAAVEPASSGCGESKAASH